MIVLTGGAGFIGSCFLKTLNDKGISDVLVVDRLGNGTKWKNLTGKKFERFENKVVFRENLKNGKYDGQITAVFHFGACSSTTETDNDYLIDNNYQYSIDLAEFCLRNSVKFIYASSAATYGNGDNGYSDETYDELKPLNGYGFSKQLFDLWVIQNGYDKIFTGLKFFNVFGPNEYHKGDMASMIYKSYNQIKSIGMVRLFKSNTSEYSDGSQMRDFIYVKDACEVIWQLYTKGIQGGILNLGTGKSRSWNDLANAVFMALNLNSNIEYINMPENLTNQYQNFTEAEMKKLKVLGLDFNFASLEDSVNDYVTNYLSKNYLVY
ncbi:MAG: ADP-glyceromanno-heptose 6-epimerase [Candidatus Kapabacteria bacterium]|nr:ADP-glyceromanno-heptose 6-epimerase [Ignavibacteriota bacterium]MCW5886058.1 ADP-glyceromanno-heptose 6-epimerase [Candidatus Kapabacteria bacterium]